MGKRIAATNFISFLPQKARMRGKKQEAEDDPMPGKGREYRHTEPRNRTGRTSPTNEQGIGNSLMGV
ncbi:hypothetical protein [Phocaeicola sartorii]|uniref:hypothetical protein n=1 Tax=Phocaeicola sartorii TaxID=671267 RepID=UPI003518A8B8